MTRRDLVLAALSTAGVEPWTPVQVQKLFFVIDRKVGHRVGGPHFHFRPYDYGPFDPEVYRQIEDLAGQGLAQVETPAAFTMKCYRLTAEGEKQGRAILQSMCEDVRGFLPRLSRAIRSLSFAQLVSTIYQLYPDMKVNSVFRAPS